jgi:hypothetical protein
MICINYRLRVPPGNLLTALIRMAISSVDHSAVFLVDSVAVVDAVLVSSFLDDTLTTDDVFGG